MDWGSRRGTALFDERSSRNCALSAGFPDRSNELCLAAVDLSVAEILLLESCVPVPLSCDWVAGTRSLRPGDVSDKFDWFWPGFAFEPAYCAMTFYG